MHTVRQTFHGFIFEVTLPKRVLLWWFLVCRCCDE